MFSENLINQQKSQSPSHSISIPLSTTNNASSSQAPHHYISGTPRSVNVPSNIVEGNNINQVLVHLYLFN